MRKGYVIAAAESVLLAVCFGSQETPVDSLLKQSNIEFTNIAPGRKYQIQKVFDPVTKTIKFKSKDFASADDWQKMVEENKRIESLKYGAIIGDLRTKFDVAKEEDKFKIIVTLKIAEGIKHPSKFEATSEELERHSKSFQNIQPAVSLNSFFSGHGLGMPISLDKKTGLYEVKKYQLRDLRFLRTFSG